jgi:hypothetical protein
MELKSTQKKPEMFEKDGKREGRANIDPTEIPDVESLYRVAVADCLAEAKGMGKEDIDVSSIGSVFQKMNKILPKGCPHDKTVPEANGTVGLLRCDLRRI